MNGDATGQFDMNNMILNNPMLLAIKQQQASHISPFQFQPYISGSLPPNI